MHTSSDQPWIPFTYTHQILKINLTTKDSESQICFYPGWSWSANPNTSLRSTKPGKAKQHWWTSTEWPVSLGLDYCFLIRVWTRAMALNDFQVFDECILQNRMMVVLVCRWCIHRTDHLPFIQSPSLPLAPPFLSLGTPPICRSSGFLYAIIYHLCGSLINVYFGRLL